MRLPRVVLALQRVPAPPLVMRIAEVGHLAACPARRNPLEGRRRRARAPRRSAPLQIQMSIPSALLPRRLGGVQHDTGFCLLYTSPSPRD
eukprot:3666435-Alexandrium_andersonii.AAC.1